MAKVEVIKGGQRVENVVITTPQPMKPSGALPPDIGYVEIGVSDDRGSIWMTGQGPPTQDAGQTGDMYLDMDTGDVWQWNGTEWELQGTFAPSTDTPAEILAKLITVDGAGSLLDADTLDGNDSTYYATASDMFVVQSVNTSQDAAIAALQADTTDWTEVTGKPATFPPTLPIPQTGVTNLVTDLALKAPLASPALTGNPTAPTPPPGDADTSIATTAFVGAALAALPPSGIGEAPNDGQTYGRKSLAWATVVGGAIISDTPPAGPAPGQMWFESDSGNTFIWYADADSSQWVQVNIQPAIASNPNAGLTAETKNRIVNGAMQCSQDVGSTAGTTDGFNVADQWQVWRATSGTMTVQRMQVVTPNGSRDRIRVTVTVADAALAAGDYLQFYQAIEGIRTADFGWGSVGAKQAILRFGWKSPAGTYSIGIVNGAANRAYIANFTVAAGQANTDTVQTFVIPGDVTGTWAKDTGIGIGLSINIAAGSSFQGVAGWQAGTFFATASNSNGMVTAGAVYELFDVGLYCDPLVTSTPPRWVMPDEAEEMRACQRYFVFQYCAALISTGAYAITPVYFPERMRVTPAVTNRLPGAFANSPAVVGDYVNGPEAGYFQISGGVNANITGRLNAYNARM